MSKKLLLLLQISANRTRTSRRFFRWFLIFLVVLLLYLFYNQPNIFGLLGHPAFSVELEWREEDIIYSAQTKGTGNEITEGRFKKEQLIILHYTKYFGHLDAEPVLDGSRHCSYLLDVVTKKGYQRPFVENTTGLFNIPCRITFDKKYFNESDALIFHSHDLEPGRDVLPSERRDLRKPWIFFNQESPLKTGLDLELFPNIFNWTMTYRQDSDIYLPYAYILPQDNFNSETRSNKTGLVAWIVSNCDPPSKRQYLVYQLQKYISVDVYGWCGSRCPADSSKLDCYKYVAANYKFYLSFENSLCSDYITEKFFMPLTLHDNILPVVYGGLESEDYFSVAPEHSYINANSFNSPKDLAQFLLYLDKNETEYRKYFEWKRKFKVVDSHKGFWCNLCQRLYEHLRMPEPSVKWYKSIWKWWHYRDIRGLQYPLPRTNSALTSHDKEKKVILSCAAPPKKFTSGFQVPWKVGITGQIVNWSWKTFIETHQ